MADLLSIGNFKDDLISQFTVSFHHSCYLFAKEHEFESNQTAIVINIFRLLLERIAGLSFNVDPGMDLARAVAEFKSALSHYTTLSKTHTANEVTLCLKDLGHIVDYATNTVFQHYRLYQYAFLNRQESDEIQLNNVLEFAPNLLPLAEAMTLEAYEAEENSKIMAEAELLNADVMKNKGSLPNVDILDLLNPSELKQITLETIHGLFENMQQEVEKALNDQRQRLQGQAPKTKE